jgi:peptidoglycan/LPS O-acetylase OafA/YrhL
MTEKKFYLQQVDYIRAFASLAVALFHLGGKTLPVLKYGWLGVQMFFLLSGFIICWAIPKTYTWRMAGKFLTKRLLRIEPPYIISILLALVVHDIWVTDDHLDWMNILTHLAYLNNFIGKPYLSPVYWTLGVEFQYYLFIALCFPFIRSRWGVWFLLAVCVIPVSMTIPGAILFHVFPLFALGILYYLYIMRMKGIKELLLFGMVIAAISIYTAGWLATFAGLLALAILIMPLRSHPVVSFLSKISFSLYLTHDMIGSNLVVYLGQHLPRSFFFKSLEFFAGIVVSILFAYLFYRFIEEPSLRLSKRIAYTDITDCR